MDKVLKEMTLRTSSQNINSKILVKPHEKLEDFPSKEKLELANQISLMDKLISILPDIEHCHNFLMLLLQKKKYLTYIINFLMLF